MAKKSKKKAARKRTARKTPRRGAAKKKGKAKKTAKAARRARAKKRAPEAVRKTPTPKPEAEEVKITAAKGRPMLTWVGKRPLTRVKAFPAQLVESYDALSIVGMSSTDRDSYGERMAFLGTLRKHVNDECWKSQPEVGLRAPENGGSLFHGDNKEVLAYLLANGFRGKVDLVYIDPPFDSGADYVRKVSLRGPKGAARLAGEGYTLGEQIQYTDIWANDNYLQFMYERLLLTKELLRLGGSMYLHCDERRSHQLRCLMDEVFGTDNYRNEIIWKRTTARSDSATYNHIHDMVIFYTTGDDYVFNKQHLPYSDEYLATNFKEDEKGRLYRETPLTAPGTRTGPSGQSWKGVDPAQIGQGRHWAIPKFVRHLLSPEVQENPLLALDDLESKGRIVWAKEGEGRPNVIQYVDDLKGVELQSLWLEFGALSSGAAEYEDYPTQKPEALVERVIRSSSNPGDLVLDCFIGSGTTAAVAQKLGRRWIACDINKGAIQTTAKRLQNVIAEQIEAVRKDTETDTQGKLFDESKEGEETPPKPTGFGFTVWRVNDYDLQVQHNEAVNLACEHLGVTRTRSDPYFDGVRGKKLVKIVPFSHPLTPLDLEELKRELDARPEEDRNVTVVCLGIELAAQAWVEDWSRLRKSRGTVNRIDVIELRSDPNYGGFIQHRPAQAKVKIARKRGKIMIEIADLVSPGIVERLKSQAGVVAPKIDDWRAMVDCVMIDTAYDGEVFSVAFSDVPEKKAGLVLGTYELSAPEGKTTVAIKIIDMLGEEVLITKTL